MTSRGVAPNETYFIELLNKEPPFVAVPISLVPAGAWAGASLGSEVHFGTHVFRRIAIKRLILNPNVYASIKPMFHKYLEASAFVFMGGQNKTCAIL